LRYMDGNNPPNTIATKVPMATQTNTMHAYPERGGVGTLLVYHTMRHLGNRGIRYFQPDSMMSGGGKIMAGLVTATKIKAADMARLIATTDGGRAGGNHDSGCWAAIKKFFGCGEVQPEEEPILNEIVTYDALDVDFGATDATLKGLVDAKFDAL
jgi:hypothetical protein